MNGLEYEKYCLEWLKKQGYHHPELTKASGDQGIDILAYRKRKKYGFQCKYYGNPVGNEAVQQAYSGAAYYHCDAASVITNTTFTKSAVALAEETDVILYENVDPSSIRFIPVFHRILSLTALIAGIIFLKEDMQSDLHVFTSVSILFSGITGMFPDQFSMCFLSVLLALLSCILCFVRSRFYIMIYLIFYFLFQLIRLVSLEKQRAIFQQETIRNELKKEIETGTEEIGKHLEMLLKDEFHCEMQLKEAVHISKEHLEFTFLAGRNIEEDIALAQYSLNQMAKHEGMNDQYTFRSVSKRTLIVTMKR